MDRVDEIIAGIEGKATVNAVGRSMLALGLTGSRYLRLAREACDLLDLHPTHSTLVAKIQPSAFSEKRLADQLEANRVAGRVWSAKNPARRTFDSARRRALAAGRPFGLTLEHVERLMAPMHCSVTGIPMRMTWDGPGANPWKPSLDQIQPGTGYTASNTRAVCWAFNLMKGELDDDTVRRFAGALVKAAVTPNPANGCRLLQAKVRHQSFVSCLRGENRRSAKRRGISFDLPKQWIEDHLAVGVCSVTGMAYDLDWDGAQSRNPLAPSIDRIDSARGYTEDNCRMVTSWYNYARGPWGDEVPMTVARALV